MSFHLTSRRSKAISAFLGTILAFDAAYAASTWTVGLTSGTPGGETKAASVSDLTIGAATATSISNQLYPGATGDVALTITNPNPFPVTITSLTLPTTGDAVGYQNQSLTTPTVGCDNVLGATDSLVTWAVTGTHTLTTPIIVGANNSSTPLVVTLTGLATMGTGAPATCEGQYFSMPSVVGVAATGGAGTATTGPATDTFSN